MTVSDLRVLVSNLDEYIHIPGGIERLRKTVLHLAVSGQLVSQDPSEGTGEELYRQIQAEKVKLPKKQKALPEIQEDEVPFDIPSSWKWVRLDQVYDVRDGTHDTPKYVTKGYPLVTSKNLSSGRLEMVNTQLISENDYKKIIERSAVSKGDILFAMIGSIGNPVIVDTDDEFAIKNVALFKPVSKDTYNSKWLLNNLFSSTNKMKEKASGGVQAFVSLGYIRNFPIPLPPLAEQNRIVKKLDEIFAFIDKLDAKYKSEECERIKFVRSSLRALSHNKSTIALDNLVQTIKTKTDTAVLRKAILHLAVSGQLVSQDLNEGTGEDLYKQIQSKNKPKKTLPDIKEAPFDIPESWKWVRLADVGLVTGGGTPPSENMTYYTNDHENGIAWLTPADLRGYKNIHISHGAKSITEAGLKNSSAQLMPKGTVLFSSRAPIGHIAIADGELSTNQGFKSVVPYGDVESEYIYRWLQYYAPTIDANASGTTFREVSGTIVSAQPIPLPPLGEQKRIVQKTTELLGLVTELEKHLEK